MRVKFNLSDAHLDNDRANADHVASIEALAKKRFAQTHRWLVAWGIGG